jgi:hypothetical protein
LLGKKVEGVSQMFVTSPALMNGPVFSLFARAYGHWGSSAKALKSLCISVESLAIIANLAEQAWGKLGSSTWQGTKQIMIWMTSKKLFDSLAIDCQLLLNGKEHLY